MEIERIPKSRIEGFSDGVMAIVLTLLAFRLKTPDLVGRSNWHQYLQALAPVVPTFISFALSFTMVALYWVNHYFFIHHLRHVTVRLLWVNNLLLFWLCLLPFTTQFIGDQPTHPIPIMFYGLNLFFCALSFFALRWYASKANLFEGGDEVARAQGPHQSLTAIILAGLAVLLAPINAYAALICLVLLPALYFVPQAEQMARKGASKA